MERPSIDTDQALMVLIAKLQKGPWQFSETKRAQDAGWVDGELVSPRGILSSFLIKAFESLEFVEWTDGDLGFPDGIGAEILVDANSVLATLGNTASAIWRDSDGRRIDLNGPPELWHETLFKALGAEDGDEDPKNRKPSWDWFKEVVESTDRVHLETRTGLRHDPSAPFSSVSSAVIVDHPETGEPSLPLHIVVADDDSFETVNRFFRTFRGSSRPAILIMQDGLDGTGIGCVWGEGQAFRHLFMDVDALADDLPELCPEIFTDYIAPITRSKNDITSVHDGPERDPKLGFKEIAAELHRTIEEVRASAGEGGVDPNVTIGLFGPWGAGKSTLMGALAARLRKSGADMTGAPFVDGSGLYDIIEVNAWKWDGSKSLAAHMLDRVLAVLGPRLEARAKQEGVVKGWYARLLKFMQYKLVPALPFILALLFLAVAGFWTWGFVKHLGGQTDAGISWILPALTAVVTALSRVFQDTLKDVFAKLFQREVVKVSDQQKLERTYAEIREASKATKRTLAFFIDDLDRCTPERVGEFVESIHNLTSAGCVTIVACDEDYVAAALNARYADIVAHHPDGDGFGRGFLEKIVQVGFRMPALTDEGVREAGLIQGLDVDTEENDGTLVVTEADADGSEKTEVTPAKGPGGKKAKAARAKKKAKAGPGKKMPREPRIDTKLLSATLDEMVADFVQPLGINMRRVKALRNTVGLYLRVATVRKDLEPEDPKAAARIAAFLVADLLDRKWLDAYRLGLEDAYRDRVGLGAFSGRDELLEKLRDALGDPSKLDDLYRLLGRRPRPLPATEK